ncbi:MAG: SMI1/KNR4 family protein [Flavobacterium sp.]|nr:MAG: SMI1/KNR4 family protein [Flavobacterium sp.]
MEISTYFQTIVEKQNEMGYYFPKLLRPPADFAEIMKAEEKLGFKLNEETIELYKCADGANLDDETPCGKTGLIPIHNFLSLSAAVDCYDVQKYQLGFDDLFTVWDTGYKPGSHLFPILEDGAGNNYWVDLNRNSYNFGRIFWTNTYPCSPDYKFASLTSMFKTIAQAYTEGVFFVDHEGFLDEHSDRWLEIGKANNPEISFWNVK